MKLILFVLLSVNILFANSIVGSWSMNKSSANKAINAAHSEMERFFANAIVRSLHSIKFKKGGSCIIGGKYISKCWIKRANYYVLYGKNGRKEGTAKLFNANRLRIHLQKNSEKTAMYFTYHKSKHVNSSAPKHKIRKYRIYRAGNRYLMFLKNSKYVLVEIDNNKSVSTKDIKAIIYKKKHNVHNYSRESDSYIVRNGKYYTLFMGELIRVKSYKHIVFKGHHFYLQR